MVLCFLSSTGLPVTLLCMWFSPITNTALFALVLPFVSPFSLPLLPAHRNLKQLTYSIRTQYIIMATHASPQPPTASSSPSSSLSTKSLPARLPIFAPTFAIHALLSTLLSRLSSPSSLTNRRRALNFGGGGAASVNEYLDVDLGAGMGMGMEGVEDGGGMGEGMFDARMAGGGGAGGSFAGGGGGPGSGVRPRVRVGRKLD